ncbi:alcohol dehydrogenase family protein [Streptomyces antarcticus]|uniref:alcohol dehydrogenase family protein n=1 Tax=Streptomyces antarcticus TaxID=2996458 RepID=UPI00226DC02F|nr:MULTISPECIES: alcohol dehydrogenase family protein [unclassified Streptomyces]MCY0944143.1 alcohol dehydrogenase family protein [Streptomyces sp. H34-AA3]MCZ4086737.1 alcohol dehydrogenase family protein [Streptomyces sp. H34-S5]
MKALQWHGAYKAEVADDIPAPTVTAPGDAVVRVVRSAICGTDLHPYRGEIDSFTPGTVTGHEFTGVVEEVGPDVRHLRPGDRVVASDIIACGTCWNCRRGWHYQCDRVGLFGYDTVVGTTAVAGGHAEYVRVPFADVVLSPIPEDVSDERALLIGDVLSTGYACATGGGVKPGDTVAVVGCGPVGLLAMKAAGILGAATVLAVDPLPARRALAEEHGAIGLAPGPDLVERVRELTGGRGADVVLEAVGTDASLLSALEIVRPRGTVSAAGAHASTAMPMPTGLAFGKELTLRFVVGDPISVREPLMNLVRTGRLDPTFVISHRMPLAEAAEGFRLFDAGLASKVVLIP